MIEYLILEQKELELIRESSQIVCDNDLWEHCLKEICLLRGKVYREEGLYDESVLTKDGELREDCDRYSIHISALDNGKVVGAVRITPLRQGEELKNIEINYFFKKFNLPRHAHTFNYLLNQLFINNKKVAEVSRLVVDEEYRRFRNVHSQVGIVLITMCYSWGLENQISDAFIVQGNKYCTSDIYERLGFRIVRDIETKIPLEPFFDGSDICQLMHLNLNNPTALFIKFVDKFKPIYQSAKIVKHTD
ncbi:MAG: GNAT family N-acetyltransferase [Candidatus Omnitrophica bacterium]|nr:GNAT family N-acetyltransferase [Candidatus Omnitrophota bacterium]